MEVFTGGDHSNVVVFSDTPDQRNQISSDHNHYLPHPPQKLRPIRCTVRTSFTSDDVKPLTWHPDSDSDYFNNTQVQIQAVTAADANFTTPQPFSPLALPSSNNEEEDALSSSSSEISKSQDAVNEPVNKKKRKRKSRKKLKSFIKNMMDTVLEKQEEMHKQLIELIEKKETESIMREQAWKKQEIERAKKVEQARKQEMSHSLALISFIQKSLGQEVKIPNFPDTSNQNEETLKGNFDHVEKNEVQTPKSNDDSSNGKQVENPTKEIVKFDAGDVNLKSNGVDFESNSRRWPKHEVQALITVRAAVNQNLNGAGQIRSIWEEVAARLCRMGYHRTPKKCKEKWENMNKYYRRSNEKGNGSKSKVCTYFSELEMLYKSGLVSANYCDDEDQQKAKEERVLDVK